MKAKLFAAALLLAATPAQAVTVSWEFTATPNVVEAGSAVTFQLTPTLSRSDPGFGFPGLDGGFTISFSDTAGHRRDFWASGEPEWTVYYHDTGNFLASYTVNGYITEAQFGCIWTCPLVHTFHGSAGSTSVVVVPGPAIGAGLPGLLMLLALWRRRRCARSC